MTTGDPAEGVRIIHIPSRSVTRGGAALLAALLAVTILQSAPAGAVPAEPSFGPMIEGPAGYDGQSKCSPSAKPGVVAFGNLIRQAYPSTSWIGISRACSVGGTSEHKEGRALDWSRDAGDPAQRADADELIDWLLAEDRYGNRAANARRLGIMYIVWNRRIWGSWDDEWEVYCVQKKDVCEDPDGGYALHPHTDHVHFSFSWAGARKKTSFWNPARTFVAAGAPSGDGYVLTGGNGGVLTYRAQDHGSRAGAGFKKTFVDVAVARGGDGYWLVTDKGAVFAFGEAPLRGRAEATGVVAMGATPTGRGYWLVTQAGRVFDFGDAPALGGPEAQGKVVDIVPTLTGLGYWLVTADGRTMAFGDAASIGDLADRELPSPVVAAAPAGAAGYLLVTEDGRVFPFGDGKGRGEIDEEGGSPVIDIVPTPTGLGYWLIRANGTARAFGDAS